MEGQGEGTNYNRRGRGEQGGAGETAILLTLFREWMRHQELETVWTLGWRRAPRRGAPRAQRRLVGFTVIFVLLV